MTTTDTLFIEIDRVCPQCEMQNLYLLNKMLVCEQCGWYYIHKNPDTMLKPRLHAEGAVNYILGDDGYKSKIYSINVAKQKTINQQNYGTKKLKTNT